MKFLFLFLGLLFYSGHLFLSIMFILNMNAIKPSSRHNLFHTASFRNPTFFGLVKWFPFNWNPEEIVVCNFFFLWFFDCLCKYVHLYLVGILYNLVNFIFQMKILSYPMMVLVFCQWRMLVLMEMVLNFLLLLKMLTTLTG